MFLPHKWTWKQLKGSQMGFATALNGQGEGESRGMGALKEGFGGLKRVGRDSDEVKILNPND